MSPSLGGLTGWYGSGLAIPRFFGWKARIFPRRLAQRDAVRTDGEGKPITFDHRSDR